MLGPVDEWLTSHLISQWREDVWDNALRYLELNDDAARAAFRQQIEHTALERGTLMLKIKS